MPVPRGATGGFHEGKGDLVITFEVDLGELAKGHHVIARGIDLGHDVPVTRWQQEGRQRFEESDFESGGFQSFVSFSLEGNEIVDRIRSEAALEYEFIPGVEEDESSSDYFFWYWILAVSDDVGTEYQDHNNGCLARFEGGAATRGTRDLGGTIPESASRLTISFAPPSSWTPTQPIRQELVIDLQAKQVVD
jgi:hypothetical protein